jgi:DNA (cytosine-5)-methyltransferase 1
VIHNIKMQKKLSKRLKKIRLGELFCGPGGLAAGAAWAATKVGNIEISHAWAIDNDPDTCETYINNIKGASYDSVFCEDIRTFDFTNLQQTAPVIDGLAFGFPCNDFSLVGQQKGINGKYGPLYTFGIKALEMFTPDFFIAENVGGILSSNKGRAIEEILYEMSSAGYEAVPHIYKFEEYGVPQARHRLIIVGFRSDLGLVFKPPKPTHINKHVSAREALEKKYPVNVLNHDRTIQSKTVIDRLKYISAGQNAWNAPIPPRLQLKVKGAKLSQIYKRLHPDKPAYTITGSGGGGTHVYHWKENRALTNRERARLQTFKDSYEFIGGKESVRRQIGMAVPPKGAAVIFEAVIKTLLNIEYPYVEPTCIFERRKNWK